MPEGSNPYSLMYAKMVPLPHTQNKKLYPFLNFQRYTKKKKRLGTFQGFGMSYGGRVVTFSGFSQEKRRLFWVTLWNVEPFWFLFWFYQLLLLHTSPSLIHLGTPTGITAEESYKPNISYTFWRTRDLGS